jgi:tetratricopeptide (TPR) repeat protein
VLWALVLAGLGAAQAQAATPIFASDSAGSETARASLALCEESATAPAVQREQMLARGVALAEEAIRADDSDAKAHFALFCSLGRKLEADGAGLSAVAELRRLRQAIERSLELAPDFIDALVAKGALLAKLPWLLGGDTKEAERLVRRAVSLAPGFAPARIHLAHVLAMQGNLAEAQAQAREAVRLALGIGAAFQVAEARALASELGA